MKLFKFFLLSGVLSLALTDSSFATLNDDLDKNSTPSELEARENEEINSSDAIDDNVIPGKVEERQKQEEIESDYSQKDDSEKSYDPLDQEGDE